MKNILLAFFVSLILNSCNETTNQKVVNQNEQTKELKTISKNESKKKSTTTYLCKINGEDWGFTKASGIISLNKKTNIKTAFITFKNKLKKGSESIQLRYDADTFKIKSILVTLKQMGKNDKKISATYTLGPETVNKNPQTFMSGTIDLSNQKTASGIAEFKIENSYEKSQLKNPKDILLHITDLKFSGVGYSDINKFAKKYK